MGLGKESVKAILLTHAHPDHIGGCGAFPDAEIFAMAAERSLLEGRAASRSLIGVLIGKKDSGLHIARYLQTETRFSLGTSQFPAIWSRGTRTAARPTWPPEFFISETAPIPAETEHCCPQRDL
jgi:glyoxylase-like metal-dependent hydrolase (beta-lactamase superfamily II)